MQMLFHLVKCHDVQTRVQNCGGELLGLSQELNLGGGQVYLTEGELSQI